MTTAPKCRFWDLGYGYVVVYMYYHGGCRGSMFSGNRKSLKKGSGPRSHQLDPINRPGKEDSQWIGGWH